MPPLALTLAGIFSLHAADDSSPATTTPPSQEALEAMRHFQVASNLSVDVFASEPMVQNLVSFCFDEQGRVYAVETHRRRTSVFDVRGHAPWLDADLSFTNVQNRIDFLKRAVTGDDKDFISRSGLDDLNQDGTVDWRDLEVESERIRLLTDRDGDGSADEAVTFADGFNTLVSGVAAGVLARDGKVWFTCIPDLWLLTDTDGDDRADLRESLHSGFGVHIAFGGHDMHGLTFGPDGRLYWSIADRGAQVRVNGRIAADHPHTGAIFRCQPDGSEFEVVAFGLRNPQELAFDQFGNLWTADNNADGGDKARLVYVLEGSDSGWRIGWQWLPRLGAWNSERLWHVAPGISAAYILPPVGYVGRGPAGFAYYPGTGMPDKYQNHFLMCDFPDGVRSFSVQPRGAGFEVINDERFLWNIDATDVEFAPGGGAFVSDWVEGWAKTGKGRIYRVFDPEALEDPLTLETQRLLAEGMRRRSNPELAGLLAHADQRVRLGAQFELANRRDAATLTDVTRNPDPLLARLHAVWGLGQIARHLPDTLRTVVPLLSDTHPEVRAQAARVLGERRAMAAQDRLIGLLLDDHPRVQCFAAMALGRLGSEKAVPAILDFLKANADRDPWLRHAGVMALVWINDVPSVLAAADHSSPAVRLAALLTLRRLEHPEISRFLNDSEPAIVLEAARAINDVPIPDGMPALARLINREDLPEFLGRRVLNAAFRVGGETEARALASFAARTNALASLRIEALDALSLWPRPSGRDRITGLWRPLAPRDVRTAADALRPWIPSLLDSRSPALLARAIDTLAALRLSEAGPQLASMATDPARSEPVRIAALNALGAWRDPRLPDTLDAISSDAGEALRRAAAEIRGRALPGGNLETLATILKNGTTGEQQVTLAALATRAEPGAADLVNSRLEQLIAGRLKPELHLDVLEAAAQLATPELNRRLEQYRASLDPDDPLAPHRPSLYGGDIEAGRKLFQERQDLACQRCHAIEGAGGEVGPSLNGIGTRQDREYLLESILVPNARIAENYETVVVLLKNGAFFSGLLKEETERELVLVSLEDGVTRIAREDVQSRAAGPSSMPEGLDAAISPGDLRDLIAYLASLK
jgi:quinoprotein glucose dehydrogenase